MPIFIYVCGSCREEMETGVSNQKFSCDLILFLSWSEITVNDLTCVLCTGTAWPGPDQSTVR